MSFEQNRILFFFKIFKRGGVGLGISTRCTNTVRWTLVLRWYVQYCYVGMYCTYIQYVGTINFGPIGPRHFLFGKRIRRSKKQRPHCWSSVRTLLFLPILSSKPYFWPRKKCFWIVVVILFLLFNLQNFVLFSVNIVVYFCTVVENYTHFFFATWTSVLFIFVAVIILTFSFTQQLSVAVFLQSFQRQCVCAAHMPCSLRQMPLLVSYSWICLYISVQPHRFCDLLPVWWRCFVEGTYMLRRL